MRYQVTLVWLAASVICANLVHEKAIAKEIEVDAQSSQTVQGVNDEAPSEGSAEELQPKIEQAKPAPPPTTLRISINLTKQKMTVSENGNVAHVWSISSGRAGYRTPTGSYRPQWLSRMHYSKKYDNAPMPYSVFFHKGYAIHGTYATRRLGSTASHGCIRLAPSNAKKLFRLVNKHSKAQTRIAIHGVARDTRRWIAKKSNGRRYRKARTTTQFSPFQSWFAPTSYKKKPVYKKKKSKPKVTYYKQPAYRWPGD